MNIKEQTLNELACALDFFDRVRSASLEEQIAVGQDHWNWLEIAVRKVVEEIKDAAAVKL